VKPVVFLLADAGYPPYAQTIVTTRKVLQEKPEQVRKFLQATAEGWRSYLKNPAPGNALIKQANPQMEDELMVYGLRKMLEFGLVTGGDAKTQGILSMSDARWKQTFDFMVSAGLVKPDVDYRKAYTLDAMKGVRVLP
jgi:NitT/TauT family transport system substrate-binding protein